MSWPAVRLVCCGMDIRGGHFSDVLKWNQLCLLWNLVMVLDNLQSDAFEIFGLDYVSYIDPKCYAAT